MVAALVTTLLLLAAGRAAWALAAPSDCPLAIERWALSFGLGAGITALAVFDLSLAGVGTSPWTVISAVALPVAALAVRKRRAPQATGTPFRIASLSGAWLLLPILPAALLLFVQAVAFPVGTAFPWAEWDAFAIWLYKGKVMLDHAVRWSPYFHDVTKSYSHLDYPLLVPSIAASVWSFAGSAEEPAARAVLSLFYAGLLGVIYAASRTWLAPLVALWIVWLVGAAPSLLTHAGAGTADVPFAFFVACAALSLLRWAHGGRLPRLVHAALFTAFALFTKQEGIAFALSMGAGLLVVALARRGRQDLAGAALFVAILALAAGPWIAFRSGLPHTHIDYGGRISLPLVLENHSRVGPVLSAVARLLVDFSGWGPVWPALLVAAVLSLLWKRDRGVGAVAIVLVAQSAAYLFAYVVSPWSLSRLLPVTLPRLAIHVLPLVAMLGSPWLAHAGRRGRTVSGTGGLLP